MELQKNKKRAARRKRNLLARELKMNKALHEKRVEPKRKREKFSVKEAEYYLAEEDQGGSLDDVHYTSATGSDRFEHRISRVVRRRDRDSNPRRMPQPGLGSRGLGTRDPACDLQESTDALGPNDSQERREYSSTDSIGSSDGTKRQS